MPPSFCNLGKAYFCNQKPEHALLMYRSAAVQFRRANNVTAAAECEGVAAELERVTANNHHTRNGSR